MKFLVSLVCLVFLSTAQAASKRDVNNLLLEAQDELLVSNANSTELDQAAQHIRSAIAVLRHGGQGGGGQNQDCVDFAFSKYNLANSSSTALDKAIAACRDVADVNLMMWLFSKYNLSNSTSTAMDKAAAGSVYDLMGKLDIVEFAFSKYNLSNSTSTAVDKSLAGAKTVLAGSLQCVIRSFEVYNQSSSTSTAMDKAFLACQ